MKKTRMKPSSPVFRFESLRLPEDETHAQGGWQPGCEVSTTSEQNRGRYEKREVVVIREMNWWPRSWKWAGLQSIICVRRETMRQRHCAERPTVEMHYYLSSSEGRRRPGPPHPQPLVGRTRAQRR
ncbi:MAG: hypothetical protein IPK32_03210 [Verrucomicrobiaceae bacterium]|nr:hypothetical protein [Verrucomicrobiaceae bacterium]